MDDIHVELQKTTQFFQKELSQLQIGRASVSLVDGIEVEAYGSKQPIRNLANIATPDIKQITIEPWDKSISKAIEKAILEANIGFTPILDGNMVRINIPLLTEERRKDIVKIIWKMAEEAKISVRNVRQEYLKKLKAQEKELGEDQVKGLEKKAQEKVDLANKDIETSAKKKEEEVMKV